MSCRYFKSILLVFTCIFSSSLYGYTQVDNHKQLIEVSMRMIGHRALLLSGDSTSLVMPISKEEGRYKISFASAFEFKPDKLVASIDSVVVETRIASNYLVEIEKCETQEVVHSYKASSLDNLEIIPCGTRAQPKACYNIFFTILDAHTNATNVSKGIFLDKASINYFSIILPIILILFVLGGGFFFGKKKNLNANPDIIPIGKYLFNKNSMKLSLGSDNIELTNKEADLLFLLHAHANTTLERETILNVVWGDDGNYVGRTLDVFISKLRKKLEADPSIKITNIRGIGYKLIIDVV